MTPHYLLPATPMPWLKSKAMVNGGGATSPMVVNNRKLLSLSMHKMDVSAGYRSMFEMMRLAAAVVTNIRARTHARGSAAMVIC